MGVVALTSVDDLIRQAPHPVTSWMSPSECAVLSGISAVTRHRQFVAGHFLARRCLACVSGQPWETQVVESGPDGAPTVLSAPAPTSWHLSISHSGERVACAVAEQAVGVDVEVIRVDRDTEGMALLCMGPREQRALQQLPAAERLRAFYARWTLKEAWLKQSSQREALASMEFHRSDAACADALLVEAEEYMLAVVSRRLDTLTLDGLPHDRLAVSTWARLPL